jgi:hypothetical protein
MMRTRINDLPETSVELSDAEMRIVSGALTSTLACYSNMSVGSSHAAMSFLGGLTNVHTGNDWDTQNDF